MIKAKFYIFAKDNSWLMKIDTLDIVKKMIAVTEIGTVEFKETTSNCCEKCWRAGDVA